MSLPKDVKLYSCSTWNLQDFPGVNKGSRLTPEIVLKVLVACLNPLTSTNKLQGGETSLATKSVED